MKVLNGEQLLMRIYIGEADSHGSKPLHHALVDLFRERKLAGATVLRGILGFGAKSHLHSAHLLRLSQDLPLVIEVVDTQENIDRVMPEVEEMVTEGLITMEPVRVIRYAPGGNKADPPE